MLSASESDTREPIIAQQLKTGSVAPVASVATTVSELAAAETDQAATSAAAYREGINLASSAYVLSQSAFSPDDWGLIASRWQRAADALEKVSKEDKNYGVAQQKMGEYTRHAEAARAQATAMQTPVSVPTPASRQPSSNPLELSPSPHQQSYQPPDQPPSESPAQPLVHRGVRVPIVRRLQGTPVVRVTFNGVKTYDMILDTGASRTLITRRMADELGVVTTERMIAATASQAEVSFDVGQVGSIAVGEVTLTNARVSIGEAVEVGLLGNDFLRGYDVIIRAREGVVELIDAG
ncbi:MAG: retropepsin-like aspartic protease [Cyanobacteria bacterium J06614_10]